MEKGSISWKKMFDNFWVVGGGLAWLCFVFLVRIERTTDDLEVDECWRIRELRRAPVS